MLQVERRLLGRPEALRIERLVARHLRELQRKARPRSFGKIADRKWRQTTIDWDCPGSGIPKGKPVDEKL
jgi:hypothetical protein